VDGTARFPIIKPRPITWPEALDIVQTGDLLQCRPVSLEGRQIVRLTKPASSGRPKWQQYSHSAMAGWKYGPANTYPRVMSGETVGHRNTHLIDLEAEIRTWPGYYDLWRVPRESQVWWPEKSWDAMCAAAGSGYGHRVIFWQWCYHRLPFAKYWLPRIPNSESPSAQRVCCGLVHWALRQGQGPQVARYDCEVTPNDLPRIAVYVATLFHSQQQVENFLFSQERLK
jgi:hypothetical protein